MQGVTEEQEVHIPEAESITRGADQCNEEVPRVVIWVNPIPMEGGILSGDRSAASRFTPSHLRKLLTYMRNKGKHAYPWLSYSVWQHIAVNKLHMSEDLSWLYFETFDTVSDVEIKDRLKLLHLLSTCDTSDDLSRLHKQVYVDTVKFIVFLYLQNAPRLSLCAPLVTGEEWPSPGLDHKSKSSSDHSHSTFIRSHLPDILQMIAEPNGEVSIESLRALEFLLLSSVDKQSLLPLSSVAQIPSEQANNGLSETSRTFPLTQLDSWLRSCLLLNPYGPQAMKGGARDRRCFCFRSDSLGRIVTNVQLAPSGCRTVLLHGITKQTLAKGNEGLRDSVIYIQNCKGSYIYLLGSMKSVVIEKCSRCVLVLGAIERTLVINHCNTLCVVAACRRVHINSTSYSTFHLLTPTRPLLFANNHNLTFAPYNTHYSQLEEHLDSSGLLAHTNFWDQPFCLTTGDGEGVVSDSVWSLMDPRDFYKMDVPFQMDGLTKVNPFVLPEPYRIALKEREKRISTWHEEVKKAQLSSEKQKELQRAVQEKFKEWLEVTGHKREIYDLGRGISKLHTPTDKSSS